jgi:hypothetical protein
VVDALLVLLLCYEGVPGFVSLLEDKHEAKYVWMGSLGCTAFVYISLGH